MTAHAPARCPFTGAIARPPATEDLPRLPSAWPRLLPDLGAVAGMLRAPDTLLAAGAALAGASGAFRLRVGFDDWVVATDPAWTQAWARLTPEDADPFEFRLRMPSLRLPGLCAPDDAEASARDSRQALARRCSPEAVRACTPALVDAARRRLAIEARPDHPDAFGLLLRAVVDMTTAALLPDADGGLPHHLADDYRTVERALTVQDLFLPRACSPRAWRAAPARRRIAAAWRAVASGPAALARELVEGARARGLPPDRATAEVAWTLNSVHWAAHRYPAVHAFWMGAAIHADPALLADLRAEQATAPVLDADALERMPLLRGCALESLRLHPLLALPRRLRRDLWVHGVRLRAGEVLAMSPWLAHRAALPDGGTFDPRRWATDVEPPPRAAFQPGGTGRWACVGMRLTVQTLTALWSVLLREYAWSLQDPTPAYRHGPIITPPATDLRVRLTRQEPA